MGFRLHIQCFPWDLTEGDMGAAGHVRATGDVRAVGDPRAVLGRLRGEVGVDGLSVWAAVSEVTQLGVRAGRGRVFDTRGGVFFAPRESLYTRLHAQPVVSTWVRGGDPLEEARKLCECHGLALRVVVSASRCGRMAERYPELACRNVFAAESRESVCLNHPHVREYLMVLLGNLAAAYAPAAIVLADASSGWSEAFSSRLRAPVPLDQAARSALAICFCECCARGMREAGIDVNRARAAAEQAVARWSGGVDSDASRDAALSAVLCEQDRASREFVVKLRASCARPILIDGGPLGETREGSATADIVAIGEVGDLAAIAEGRTTPWEIRVGADWAIRDGGASLVTLLSEAAQRGASGATIDNLALLTDEALTVLRQAGRFARRTGDHPASAE